MSERCDSTTWETLADHETKCDLPSGHAGHHDDGAMTWCTDTSCPCRTPHIVTEQEFDEATHKAAETRRLLGWGQ